jgi:hypothetical protein
MYKISYIITQCICYLCSHTMIIVISAIVFAATTSGLHILPCEPGYPGPLGCDQFVANGGQLGAGLDAGVGQVSGGGQVGGGGLIDVFSPLENIGQSPGSLVMDPAFWATMFSKMSHFPL